MTHKLPIDLTLEAIMNYLVQEGFGATVQKESNQVLFGLRIDNEDVPVFVRIWEGKVQIQMVAYLPAKIEDAKIATVGRFFNYANAALEIPGLFVDEGTQLAYYRTVLPTLGEPIHAELFARMIDATATCLRTFVPSLKKITEGNITLHSVVQSLKKAGVFA